MRSFCQCIFFAISFVSTLIASSTFARADSYCGMYCVYTVLNISQKHVSFEQLINSRYIVGRGGSTSNSIALALTEQGLHGVPVSGLSAFDLLLSKNPIVLHVRPSQASREHNHWCVYLGESGGRARILDPSTGQTTIKFSELLSLWDGHGVHTATRAIDYWKWRAQSFTFRFALLLCIIEISARVFAIGIAMEKSKLLMQRPVWQRLSISGSCVSSLLATVGVCMDYARFDGILHRANASARASITAVHFDYAFPSLQVDDVFRLLKTPENDTVFVDSRLAADFSAGTVPGSVSLPVNASFDEEAAFCGKIGKHATLVVFCQSKSCPYAHAVAQRLAARGYKNIMVFSGGIHEWESFKHMEIGN